MQVEIEGKEGEDFPQMHSEEQVIDFLENLEEQVRNRLEMREEDEVKIRLEAEIDGETNRYTRNDPRWCIYCANCLEFQAKDVEAQEAREAMQEHIDDETNGCIKVEYGIDADKKRAKQIVEAMRD